MPTSPRSCARRGGTPAVPGLLRWALAGLLGCGPCLAAAAPAAEQPPPAPLVEVELGDGTVASGRLARIDDDGVHLAGADAGGAPPIFATARVRAVRRKDAAADAARGLVVALVDGSTLTGDDFAWSGGPSATLSRPEGDVELPIGRVRSLCWRSAAGGGEPRWPENVPEGTQSDLVVVGSEANHEFVECAIAGIGGESVSVILDDERIPVKRSKVLGLQWLRSEQGAAATGSAAVLVAGGQVRAGHVAWSPEAFVLDDTIRLPAGMFVGIDYAAARVTHLATLPPEKVEVEPWFGGLARKEGMAPFFAARTIPSRGTAAADGGTAAPRDGAVIAMRPRTTIAWRLPPDSRRFFAVVAAASGPQAADAAVVAVSVDGREVFRRRIDASSRVDGGPNATAAGVPIDVALDRARRLEVTVDFVPGAGIGGAVLLSRAMIER